MLLGGRHEVLPSMAGRSHCYRRPEKHIVSRTMTEVDYAVSRWSYSLNSNEA
jgi:hypothetical protein